MIEERIRYRKALGGFATGVCIVSTLTKQSTPIAMTINSFSSVSLDPKIVLWSLKRNSLCYNLFSSIGAYAICILSTTQRDISNRYALPGMHKMHSGDYYLSTSGLPVIPEVVSSFECESWKIVRAGDHDVMFGRVYHYTLMENSDPLVFQGGRYCELEKTAVNSSMCTE